MKPCRDRALEGRLNPKGIPYLYLSSERDTELAEVRPWLEASISVGQFDVPSDLTLIDCSFGTSNHKIYLAEPSAEKREAAVWAAIDRAFSWRVTPSDADAAYVPTQITGLSRRVGMGANRWL